MTEFSKRFAVRRFVSPRTQAGPWARYLKEEVGVDFSWVPQVTHDQAAVRLLLDRHMPELVPDWEALLGALPGDARLPQLLAQYNLKPFWSGCSVTIGRRDGRPVLLRNYDLGVDGLQGAFVVEETADGGWIMGSAEAGWGFLDGINSRGLAVAITFGGRTVAGDGFDVPLIVRYLLMTCGSVADAVAVLERVPCRLAQNLLLLDGTGDSAVAYVAPDRAPVIERGAICSTNHQPGAIDPGHAQFSCTVERFEFMAERAGRLELADMLRAPLYNTQYSRWFGTLYSAEYDPAAGTARYAWPGREFLLGPDTQAAEFTVTYHGE